MNPRLVAVAGPQRGTTFLLSSDPVFIGRDPSNEICMTEGSASRKHGVIANSPEGFRVKDLESVNGIYVNGIPVRERLLEPGDRIELGDSIFVFLVEDEEPSSPVLQPKVVFSPTTVRLRMEEALYLQPEKLLTSIPLTTRIARSLDALLRLATHLYNSRSTESVCRTLIKTAFHIVPAEEGAVVIAGRNPDENPSIFAYDTDLNRTELAVDRRIETQMQQDKISLLGNEASLTEERSDHRERQVTAWVAAPLLTSEDRTGFLYLQTSDVEVRFTEEHLQLVTAIAGIGAVALENIMHWQDMERDHRYLLEDIRIEHAMIGETQAMKEVYRVVAKAAPADSTVLIFGETGTGKELTARAIHLNSGRASKAFVVINCASLSESLLESELFGHEKGAFTSAVSQKKGKLEVADGGTVFLDEVGEIPLTVQSRLLRVLQEREFERLGGTRPIRVDIRWVAATNQNLEEAVRRGSFRQDLFFRLNVVKITMPPLRERKEDIPLLASYFVTRYSRKVKRRVTGISPEARRVLVRYEWTGNVRELENAIEHAVVLGSQEAVQPGDLPENILEGSVLEREGATKYHELILKTKKNLIEQAFLKAGGNHQEAAKFLGVDPANLHRMLRNMGLKPKS